MSLKKELNTEQVAHLDLSGFCQVTSETTVQEAVASMRAAKVNVCLIVDDNQLNGIFTDRDVLRKIAASPDSWGTPIKNVMTSKPVTILPDTPAARALWLMDDKHFRNLPAVDAEGHIIGNMTHQSVIDYLASRYPTTILNLPPRPDQFPDRVEGG